MSPVGQNEHMIKRAAVDDVIAQEGRVSIRRMRDEPEEYERMARWRNEPHVREWWDPDKPDLSVEDAAAEYAPITRGGSPDTACVIELNRVPVGFVQFYPWSDYAEEIIATGMALEDGAWGLDIFIGEPQMINKGIGTLAVDLVFRHLIENEGAASVAFPVWKDNLRALRAYEKAGFRKTATVLDTDTRGGQRVESWLMVRSRAA